MTPALRSKIGCSAYLGLLIGGFVIWAMAHGYIRTNVRALDNTLFAAAGVLFLVGGAYALIEGVVAWFQEHFPSKQRRAHTTRQAERLGMRPVADTATIDRSFPFLGATRGGTGSWWRLLRGVLALAAFIAWLLIALIYGLAAASGALDPITFGFILGGSSVVLLGAAAVLGDWAGWFRARSRKREKAGRFTTGALRPGRGPIKGLFAGRWNELDVRVFDYAYGDPETEWTCAILPLDAPVPDVEVRRESITTRLERAIGRRDLTLDDDDFDKAFRVLADAEDEARRVLNATVRARLAADAPYQFLLQMRGREMLYCTSRIDIDSRGALLQAAKRLRNALAPR